MSTWAQKFQPSRGELEPRIIQTPGAERALSECGQELTRSYLAVVASCVSASQTNPLANQSSCTPSVGLRPVPTSREDKLHMHLNSAQTCTRSPLRRLHKARVASGGDVRLNSVRGYLTNQCTSLTHRALFTHFQRHVLGMCHKETRDDCTNSVHGRRSTTARAFQLRGIQVTVRVLPLHALHLPLPRVAFRCGRSPHASCSNTRPLVLSEQERGIGPRSGHGSKGEGSARLHTKVTKTGASNHKS
mmetsp:Transcript_46290/g.122881  ORF Transcript_46290/g.122881 Transcript_46290/m.122881 type:complete len:246 (+) Transcript_46290:106-843(+)